MRSKFKKTPGGNLARQIQEWRESLGLTQEQLAQASGVNRSVIAHLEQSMLRNIEVLELHAILDTLLQTDEDLAKRESEAPSSTHPNEPLIVTFLRNKLTGV